MAASDFTKTPAFTPAARLQNIGVSEILAIGARASALKQEGVPVISLSAGEPDFETPTM